MKNRWLPALLAGLLITLGSCVDDKDLLNPDDMVTLNVMDEDHGRTPIGLTDLYMTADHNLVSPHDYYICDFGQVLDLGHIEEQKPSLTTVTNVAAVTPNEGYLVFLRDETLRFPSGLLALSAQTVYYRLWVDDWIKDGKQITGARMNFAQYTPDRGGVPQWDMTLATVSTADAGGQIDVEAPKGNLEAMTTRTDVIITNVQAGKRSTRVTLRLPQQLQPGTIPLWFRCGNTFSRTWLVVE